MLIQKIGYKQLYPDIELTIAQDDVQFPDDEKLKQMSCIQFNTISTTLKNDHDTFVDFKVIELVLIFQSLLIALITGIPYLLYFYLQISKYYYFVQVFLRGINASIRKSNFICYTISHFLFSQFQNESQNDNFCYYPFWYNLLNLMLNLSQFFFQFPNSSLIEKRQVICRQDQKVISSKQRIGLHLIVQIYATLSLGIYLIYLRIKTEKRFKECQPNRVQIGQQLINALIPVSYF